jgi:ligand-binding sensor domain-containing protein
VKARRRLTTIAVALIAVAAAIAGVALWLRSGGWRAQAPSSWTLFDLSPVRHDGWLTYRCPRTYTCLEVAGGHLWVGTDGGVIERYDVRTGAVTYFPCDRSLNIPNLMPVVSGIQVDADEQAWACIDGQAVCRLAGDRFTHVGELKSVAARQGAFCVTDKAGRKWLTIGPEAGKVLQGGRWVVGQVPGDPPYEVGTKAVADSPVALDTRGVLWAVLLSHEGPVSEGEPTGAIGAFDGRRWQVYGEGEGIRKWFWVQCRNLFGNASGQVWLEEQDRILRFDGTRWRPALVYGDCRGVSVQGLLGVDDNGDLWVCGTEAGLSFLSRVRGSQWVTYHRSATTADGRIVAKTAGAPADAFDGLLAAEDCGDGRVAALSESSALVVEGHKVRVLAPLSRLPAAVTTLAADDRGRVWLLLENDTFACFDGREWRHGRDKEQAGEQVSLVMFLGIHESGRLYAAGQNGQVCHFDGARWRYFLSPEDTRFDGPFPGVHDLACAAAGCIWLATEAGALTWVDGQWRRSAAEGGPEQPVRRVIVDRRGRPWFGGIDSVFVLDRGRWEQLSPGLDGREVTAIAEGRRGRVWIGSDGAGVRVYDGHSWTSHTSADGLPSDNVRSLACDRKGRTWVGTDSGLVVWMRQEWRVLTERDGLISNDIQQVAVDGRGWVWVRTPVGLSVLEGGELPG